MRTPKSARRPGIETLSTFALRAGGAGALFGFHFLLAYKLRPSQFGVVSFALTTASLLSIGVTLGLPTATMRFAAEYMETQSWSLLRGLLQKTLAITVVAATVSSVVLAGVSFIPGLAREPALGLRLASVLLPLVALHVWRGRAARGLGQVLRAYLPEEILIPTGAALLIVALGVGGATRAVLAYGCVSAAALLLALKWLRSAIPHIARRARATYATRRWMSMSMPMVFATGMELVLNKTDVFLLGNMVPMEEVGIYTAALKIALLASLSLRVANSIVGPRIAAAHARNEPRALRRHYLRGLALSIAGSAPIAIVTYAAPGLVLGLLGTSYLRGVEILKILVLGQFLNAATGPVGILLLMTDRQREAAAIITAWAVTNAVANVLAIPIWHSLGCAVVTTFAIGGMNLSLFMLARRRPVLRGAR